MQTEFEKMLDTKLQEHGYALVRKQKEKLFNSIKQGFEIPMSIEEYEKTGGRLVYGKPYCELYPLEVPLDF